MVPDIQTDFGQFLESVILKLQTHPFITDPANVIMGQTNDMLNLKDSEYPRIELRPVAHMGTGYISQREQSNDYIMAGAAYLKRDSNLKITIKDCKDIIAMGELVRVKLFEFLDDCQRGQRPSPGFLMMDGMFEIDYDFELFDDVSTAVFAFRAYTQSSDTEA